MWKSKFFIFTIIVLTAISCSKQPRTLVILHTNDCHSRVEPTSNNLGGFEYRKYLIDSIRKVNANVLLLDAGDIVQGTPYFNVYGGQVEVEAYNEMGYDAITLGNHEFDNGVDGLAKMLKNAQFSVVCSNYDATNTVLANRLKKYLIIEKGGLKIGIIGLGIMPDKVILPDNFRGIIYSDPIETTNHYAHMLKSDKKCDLVIVLSHLGYTGEMGDSALVAQTQNVDLILGGHTHNVRGIFRIPNLNGDTVIVAQSTKSCEELTKTVVEY
ncbi:MAG: metallophosphoesterase [Paludibacteraceae bacterium]|jgi:5'-nucleotidase|nr:metallophosphoesterase [Paludibacteraceae bacterium]MDI9536291.1 metallophosphoesterase [Bacteroidota bacterium]HHT61518.1 bifunctional metallophosphatase/5'-nucleotidase [Bacteroidales bacterium]MBP9038843.1 metallophosphoesterase [Paludibacteraceae bacterium]HOA46039.1 metallophosphoesterase [Paludibacteraceae bacterium]